MFRGLKEVKRETLHGRAVRFGAVFRAMVLCRPWAGDMGRKGPAVPPASLQ